MGGLHLPASTHHPDTKRNKDDREQVERMGDGNRGGKELFIYLDSLQYEGYVPGRTGMGSHLDEHALFHLTTATHTHVVIKRKKLRSPLKEISQCKLERDQHEPSSYRLPRSLQRSDRKEHSNREVEVSNQDIGTCYYG